jgi:hypothetical protein
MSEINVQSGMLPGKHGSAKSLANEIDSFKLPAEARIELENMIMKVRREVRILIASY